MFVALGTIFLEVYNYIDFPEIRVYLDIFFRDPCSFNPELTAVNILHFHGIER